jgi:hypothetical protein
MAAHIRERVLLLASDKRAILCGKHPEQGRVTDATGALPAGPPHARCSLDLQADLMPDDSGDFRPGRANRRAGRDGRAHGPGWHAAGWPSRGRGARLAMLLRGVIEADVKLIRDPEDLVEKLDTLLGPAAEPENAVLTDSARVVRRADPVSGLFSVILLSWTVYVAASLPSRQGSPTYDTAWAGFDVMLLVALAGTAYFWLRRSRYLSTAATAAAALRLVRRPDNSIWPAAPVDLAGRRRRAAARICVLVAQLPHPAARQAQVRPAAATPAEPELRGEQAHMTATRLPAASHYHGSSIP